MAQEIINTGALPNDGNGDPLRVAFTKINNNFFELYSESSSEGPNGSVQYNKVTIGSGATAHSEIIGGVVTNIVIDLPGSGYKSLNPPIVNIIPSLGDTTGFGATAIAEVTDDYVSSIIITSGGNNYVYPPSIEFVSTTDNELQGSPDLIYNLDTHSFDLGANIFLNVDNTYSIGNTDNRVKKIYLNQTGAVLGNIAITESGNTLTFSVTANSQIKSDAVFSNVYSQTLNATVSNIANTKSTSVTATTTGSDSQVILSIPAAEFSSGKFNIVSRQNNTPYYQSVTVDAIKLNNGNDVKYVVYGTLFSGQIIISSYGVEVFNNAVRLLVSPTVTGVITHTISYTMN